MNTCLTEYYQMFITINTFIILVSAYFFCQRGYEYLTNKIKTNECVTFCTSSFTYLF